MLKIQEAANLNYTLAPAASPAPCQSYDRYVVGAATKAPVERAVEFLVEGDLAEMLASMSRAAKLSVAETIARALLDLNLIHNQLASGKTLWIESREGLRAQVEFNPTTLGGERPEISNKTVAARLSQDSARIAQELSEKTGLDPALVILQSFQAFAFLLECRLAKSRVVSIAPDGSEEIFKFVRPQRRSKRG